LKLFPNLVKGITQSLRNIFEKRYHADKVIEYLFNDNPKWGSRDRAFVAESVFDMVRQWRRLWAILEKDVSFDEATLTELFGVYWIIKTFEVPDWTEFADLNIDVILQRDREIFSRSIQYSIDDTIDAIAFEEIGERWETELAAMNKMAEVVIRTNTIKISVHQLLAEFEKEQMEIGLVENMPEALILKQRRNLFSNQLFKNGWFEVQDAGSQLIAPFLKVEPGMRVIDACAGAGGKTLHIATLMQNKGRIIAMDIEAKKLEEVKRRSKRNGVSIIETKWIENSKTIKRLHETADRLLLDVPCSGLGVLKRNPDAKYKIDPNFIKQIKITQQDIIQRYSGMLKKGGMMVYATCSLLPSENNKQIETFLANNKNFSLLEEKMIYPSEFGFDGFYMARLLKN
jgi:16S rRNA (cytosine967-C5)-methyltransferase